MTWKYFQDSKFELCVSGKQRVSSCSAHTGPVLRGLEIFVVVRLNKPLTKQSRCQLFKVHWNSYDTIVVIYDVNSIRYHPILATSLRIVAINKIGK